MRDWMSEPLRGLITELAKSPYPAAAAAVTGEFPFFVSSQSVKRGPVWLESEESVLLGTGGEASVHLGSGHYAYSTEVWAIRSAGSRLHTRFLFRILQARKRELDYRAFEGSGLRHLRKEFVRSMWIPVPPLEEQRRIAAILDTIDEAIRVTERVISKLQDLRSGTARDLLLHRGVGRGWRRVRLSEVATIGSGATPDRARAEYWRQGSVPWVKTSEVAGDPIRTTGESITAIAVLRCSLRVLPVGTVLVAMYGQGRTRGRSAILALPATTNQACAAIEPSAELRSAFLFELLQVEYERLRAAGHGSHQLNLSNRIIGAFEVSVPPPDEQDRCVTILNAMRERIDVNRRSLEKYRAIGQGLATDLISGPVRTVVS